MLFAEAAQMLKLILQDYSEQHEFHTSIIVSIAKNIFKNNE